jgi:OOP family OmpA-OmpF porin
MFAKFSLAQSKMPENKTNSTKNATNKTNSDYFNDANYSKWSIALNGGTTLTYLDIEQDVLNKIFGLSLKYSFGHVAAIRVQGLYGTLSGKNSNPLKLNGGGYVNDITSVGVHFIGNFGSLNFRKKNPNTLFYVLTGLNITKNDAISDKVDGNNKKLTNKGANFSIPIGLGGKYKLNNQFDLGLEGILNFVNSDRMDLYSDDRNTDLVGSLMFTLGYNFTGLKKSQHIDWANPVATIYDDLARKSAKATDDLKRDGDGDGIPDYIDLELNTKAGYKVNVKGETLDSDVDGIPDTEDADPYGFNQMLSVYYPAENFKVKTSTDVMKFSDSIPEADFITLNSEGYGLPVITFAPNKYDIHVEQYPLLQHIARILKVDTSVSVAIIGHADNNKPDLTQLTIAEKRALAVKRQLMKIYEIESERLLIFSERDVFVRKYKMQTEGLDRKAEFRLIRKQQ